MTKSILKAKVFHQRKTRFVDEMCMKDLKTMKLKGSKDKIKNRNTWSRIVKGAMNQQGLLRSKKFSNVYDCGQTLRFPISITRLDSATNNIDASFGCYLESTDTWDKMFVQSNKYDSKTRSQRKLNSKSTLKHIQGLYRLGVE